MFNGKLKEQIKCLQDEMEQLKDELWEIKFPYGEVVIVGENKLMDISEYDGTLKSETFGQFVKYYKTRKQQFIFAYMNKLEKYKIAKRGEERCITLLWNNGEATFLLRNNKITRQEHSLDKYDIEIILTK